MITSLAQPTAMGPLLQQETAVPLTTALRVATWSAAAGGADHSCTLIEDHRGQTEEDSSRIARLFWDARLSLAEGVSRAPAGRLDRATRLISLARPMTMRAMQITLAWDAFRSKLVGVARLWCRKGCGFSPSRASHGVSVLCCGSFPSSLEFVSVILEETLRFCVCCHGGELSAFVVA